MTARRVGAALVVVLALLAWFQLPGTDRLQSAWFDAYQAIAPRQVSVLPVTVVEIDQKSLLALGQWPWPRTQLARLVIALRRADAAAIGLNVLMPEADALSPARLLADLGAGSGAGSSAGNGSLVEALRAMPSNDATLAAALAGAPTVLVFAGTNEETGRPLRAAPITVQGAAAGGDRELGVPHHAGALTSIDEINRQASGWGLISVDTTRGIVRRIPLVASIQGTLVPTMAIEMLRVAYRMPTTRLQTSGTRVTRCRSARRACAPRPTARCASTSRAIAPTASSPPSTCSKAASIRRC